MSLEAQNARCADPGASPGADGWGWALVQRDWSLRQGEPGRPGVLAALAARVAAVIARVRRVVGLAGRGVAGRASPPDGGGSGTRRSSARPSSSRGC